MGFRDRLNYDVGSFCDTHESNFEQLYELINTFSSAHFELRSSRFQFIFYRAKISV